MKYCPISTTLTNPASMQNLLTLSVCESLSIRSSYRCNRKFWYAGSWFSKGTSVLISLITIDCPTNITGCPRSILMVFSMSFALELTPGQWSRGTEGRMSASCKFQQHLLCNVVLGSLWTVLGRIPLFLRTWSNKWPLSNTKFSRKYFHDSGICQTFTFVAFSVTRRCHWTVT